MKSFLLGLLVIFWSSFAMGANLYTFNGGGTSGNWTDPAIWTTDPTGSTSINPGVPANGDNVTVTNSFVVYVPSAIATTGLSITIQRGGVLDLTTASSTFATLSSLSGQGVLRVAAPYFPVVTTNNFDKANTGTVEFYNWPAGPTALPNPASGMYNNLRLLNTTATAYIVQLDNNLTISGSLTLTRTNTLGPVTLNLGQTASTNRTLNVLGDITIGTGTFVGVTAVAGSHTLNASGSLVNSGTINLHNGTTDDTQVALLNFTGATPANFACNGPTSLDILRVDKGIDSQVLLNVTAQFVNAQGYLSLNHVGIGVDLLQLVNGVTKLGGNIQLTKISNVTATGTGFSLGSSASSPTLWVAGATVHNDNANAFIIYGTYRISTGLLTSVNFDAMVVREDGQLLIEGGTTTVDKFRPSSTSSTHRGSFIISGGLFESVGSYVGSITVAQARFAIPYITQAFRMTGGTIRVVNPNNSTGAFHIGVDPNNAIVTGGTIEVVLPSDNTNAAILTTAPLWNLTIKKPVAGGTSKALLSNITSQFTAGATNNAQPLTVQNNFILDGTNPVTFDAANLNLTIQGTFTLNSNSTYLTGTNNTIFSGAQDQSLVNNGTIGTTAGNGTFNNWTVNKTNGTLTLNGTVANYFVPVGATLSLLKGVLNDGGKSIFIQGNIVNSASHTSAGGGGSITMNGATAQTIAGDGTGVFGNLNISSSVAAGTVAVTLGANMAVANTLTLQSNNILAIGSNRLSLTSVLTSALQPLNGFSNTRMIQTAGLQSDLGLQKTYGGPQSFTFPVGTGTKYTPATIDLQLATGLAKYGQVSISPVSSRNPFVASTTNSLGYYWKVRSTGFGTIPSGAIYSTFQMINADAAGYVPGPPSNYVAGRYLPTAWNTSFNGGVSSFGTYSNITFNALDQFDGEFTAGQSATFGPITSYYTRVVAGNWETAATWSTAGFNGAAAAVKPGAGNPVFIGTGSTVTVTANTAVAGSLEIATGGTLDVQAFTGHNFGALPDSKPGGSGTLRITGTVVKSGANYFANPVFPSGDFGSFLQAGGGTVEYYGSTSANAYTFNIPTSSASSLNLSSYQNLILNPVSNGSITMPNLDLRIFNQMTTGSTSTFPGIVNVSGTAAGNLRVGGLMSVLNGTLRFANGTARTLTLDNDLLVGAGATFDTNGPGAAVVNSITLAGSLTNNGTLNFNTGGKTAAITFLGSTTNSLTTAASTTTSLYTLTLNKGTGRAATLSVDGAGSLTTPTNGWLTLTNGTLRYAKPSTTLTIHDGVATPYLITDNAGLTMDASGATVTVATNNNAAADLKVAGLVQVLQGTLQVGATGNVGNDMEYASAGAPGLKVTGGTLYVNGQIRRSVNNLDGSLRFDQSGGTIDIDGQGATALQNNERGLFEVQGLKSIFRMSGGTMTLHRSNGRPTIAADFYLAPDSTVVTGGTVVLGNAAAGVGNVIISVNSTVPIYDLRVESGANATNLNTGLLTGVLPLTLNGSLTIGNGNSFFNANSLGLNIKQNLINNNTLVVNQSTVANALTTGGFLPGATTQTTTFLGIIPTQLLTGTASNVTVFGSLVVNNAQPSGKLQLGGTALVTGNLTMTKGTLDDNGKTITVWGDVSNSTAHTGSGSMILAGSVNQNVGGNGTGRFSNLTLNNATGATTTANQEVTGTLNLANGVLSIGSNLLSLSNAGANAVTGAFDATHFIRTNGIVADQGVRKSYPSGLLNFLFPVGAAAKFTPVQINLTSNTAAGTITVQPVDLAHPSTTDPLNKELKYFWRVSTTGFTAATTADQQYIYSAGDVQGNEANYKLGRFVNGTWTITSGTVSTSGHYLLLSPGNNVIAGDYTGGEASEFGLVPTFYSRNATAGVGAGADWTNIAAWTYNPDGTDSSPLPTVFPTLANPVVILSGHRIYVTSGGRGAASLVLNGILDLGLTAANNFNTVSGTGTLSIGSSLFPAGNYSLFVAAGGGTVDYTAQAQLPSRDTYNNLTLSGGTPKLLTNLDLTINGTLNVALNTLVNNPTSQNITLTSATNGVIVNGALNLNDGNLTTGATVTSGSTGIINLGAGKLNVGTTLATISGGTINQGTGPVNAGTTFDNAGTYNASTGTITIATNFNNSGSYNAGAGNLNVSGNTTNTAAGVIAAAAGEINTGGIFSNAGFYQASTNNIMHVNGDFFNLVGSAFSAANSNMVLRSSFTNRGTFDSGGNPGSLVQFITEGNQFINGTTTFYDLQKLGSSALTLGTATDVHVNGLLTIQNSVIYTGANTLNTLYLDNPAIQPIVGNTVSSFVAGRLAMQFPNAATTRVFPVGAGQRYRPVTIKNTGGSTGATVLVEIINGPPAGTVDATLDNLSANRYYRIQTLLGTISAPSIQLSFNTDVTDEIVNVPGNLRVAKTATSGPNVLPTVSNTWSTAGGSGVFSPDVPRGYTISNASQTAITATSFFALASTNRVDNPLTGTAPLPVELISFTAVRQGSAVRTAWTTASEKNSAYFVVQRSKDSRTFTDVSQVEAQGSSTLRHDYSALDNSPLSGVSYYRLRQVDKDGKVAFSPVAIVRFEGQSTTPALLAYPNPATASGFHLTAVNLSAPGGTVQMFDNVGRIILTQTLAATAAETTIQPAQPLASGMYFVTWKTTDGIKLTTKVIVE